MERHSTIGVCPLRLHAFGGMRETVDHGGAHCLQEQCAWWRPPHVPLGATRDEVAGVCAILLIGRCIEHQAELASSAQKA